MLRRAFLKLYVLTLPAFLGLPRLAQAEEDVPLAGARIFLELSDEHGRTVHDTDFTGRWLLVFFGYRSCPDICPTTLFEIAQLLKALGPKAEKIQPIVVSVDPDRDSAKQLREYVDSFDPRILPLRGNADQLAKTAKSFGISYFKIPGTSPDSYTIAHSAFITLVGPEGGIAGRFSADVNVDELTSKMKKLVG
ncbi:SCO family protein [Bradyrhizobium jicamae]|uniref:SCO family protein n=1 Tax=Bradyrhizobium jicamae TaxID=280332 RepID=A0ABS5FSY4_9BRAD|nr:SCO family protein [Bradyrhizobium jicamae]MBR0799942.1 SCO family protein [Bradyrhizobium jicamae]